ncbi:MAG TPA: HAD family hydrolase [Candidatus Ruminococcus avistercoris]|nr:HAD family hydrolase [Candidatus Ruminococcus avistercoris]
MDSIIFDVDGTLWDTTHVVADAWNEVVRSETSLDLSITPQKLKTLFGKTMPDIAAILFPEEPKENQLRLIDLCCQREEEALRKKSGALYPQLESVLTQLAARLPLFLVSNCQAGYIETFLDCTGFAPYITDHLCPGDTGEGKAENIREIIRRHHLKSPVYVGDTDGDYQAVKSAGDSIPFIFASYGFGFVENPDYVITCPADLLSLL